MATWGSAAVSMADLAVLNDLDGHNSVGASVVMAEISYVNFPGIV